MCEAVAHRGPDGQGTWSDDGVGLIHRRLSIIDVEGGRQPLCNEDGSVQVIFNGEIYNHLQLRRELEVNGHRFQTCSDTETIVHLYEDHGERLVDHLRGMFAFALWDRKRQRLVLARDRIGLKPLYYYRDSQKLVFGSTIQAILTDGMIPREVDSEAIDEYLTFGVIGGDRSIFRGIHKLPAAHTLVVSRDDWRAQPRRFWELQIRPDENLSTSEWLATVDAKLSETIAAHRLSDVPVGAFLSGGLDSAAVVSKWAEQGRDLRTFSIGFEDARYDETQYARRVAERFETIHTEEIVTPEAVGGLTDLVEQFDEPFADPSALPMLALSRLARRHVKVVLSGDGGDEAFGGYTRYAHDLREASFRKRLPDWFRRSALSLAAKYWPNGNRMPRVLRWKTTLTNLSLNAPAAYANTLSLCRPEMRRRLLRDAVLAEIKGRRPERFVESAYAAHGEEDLNGMLSADIAYLLPDDFLTKVDRASMACGLEVRPPFLDHELLELTARIPADLKVRRGQTKWLLKELFRERLPDGIVDRPKQGFDVPLDAWFRGPLRSMCRDDLLDPHGPVSAYVESTAVRNLYEAHQSHRGNYGRQLWALLVLSVWLRRYVTASTLKGMSR
jgi:asparagine synthase (glutamine-hydrolysing)